VKEKLNGVLDPNLCAHRVVEIIAINKLDERHKWFQLKFADGLPIGEGEFVAVYVPGVGEAPFSICSSATDKKTFSIAVRRIDEDEPVVGEWVDDRIPTLMNVTTAMHQAKVGDEFLVRGPFGNQFPVHELKGKNVVCIAGGIGLFPVFRPLLEIAENRTAYGKVSLLFGTDWPENRYFHEQLDDWQLSGLLDVYETSANSREGYISRQGFVTNLIPLLDMANPADTYFYVVGPRVMFKPVIEVLESVGAVASNVYFSLENQMRCCTGQCGHCRVNSELICVDGPVYTLEYIRKNNMWEAL